MGQPVRLHDYTGERLSPISSSSDEGMDGPSIQPAPPTDRIAVKCPSCQATLSVRRVYIGNQVRCKQCDETFLVSVPAEPQLKSDDEHIKTADGLLKTALQDQREAAEQSSRLYQDRNQELTAAHAGLKSDYESLLDSGRLQQERWTEQLREQHAHSDETARPPDPSPSEDLSRSPDRPTAEGELQAARDQVADLERRLAESERMNRVLSDVLGAIGINYKTIKF
ncbi:MAG: hypothetical protein ACHRXM_21335 [Isosphaerales bacterium]